MKKIICLVLMFPFISHALEFSGRIIPRLEVIESDEKSKNSFSINSARLITSKDINSDLSFTIALEMARGTSLREAYLNYKLSKNTSLRFGQQSVSFNSQRGQFGRTALLFGDRATVIENISVPGGRDTGLTLNLFQKRDDLALQFGIFNGTGINNSSNDNSSFLYSFRFIYSLFGKIASRESYQASENSLTFSLSAIGAQRNSLRDWGEEGIDQSADWGGASMHLRYANNGLSLIGEYLVREVDPEVTQRYVSDAYNLSLGYFVISDMYEIVSLYGEFRNDKDLGIGKSTELSIGVNVYHQDNRNRTALSVSQFNHSDRADEELFRLEHIIVF